MELRQAIREQYPVSNLRFALLICASGNSRILLREELGRRQRVETRGSHVQRYIALFHGHLDGPSNRLGVGQS